MSPQALRFAADAAAVLHLRFSPFAVLGGLLVLRWAWLAWVHVPACLWAAGILVFPWTCPLTSLEQELRRRAGDRPYEGGFIQHYLTGQAAPEGVSGATNQIGRASCRERV